MDTCAHCGTPLTPETRIYVIGAHVYICSTPCYDIVVSKVFKRPKESPDEQARHESTP